MKNNQNSDDNTKILGIMTKIDLNTYQFHKIYQI